MTKSQNLILKPGIGTSIAVVISLLTLSPICLAGEQSETATYSIVFSARDSGSRDIYLSDEDGNFRLKVGDFTGNDGYPAVSPDGKHLAFYGKYDDNETWSIHTVNMDGMDMQRLTHERYVWDSAPSWSPDGKTIVFAREYENPEGDWQEEVWLMNADGTDQRQIEALEGRAPVFLQDGRILFHSKNGPSQICIANVDGSDLISLTNNDANDRSPKASPDGSQITFISDRDGNQEIYTMNFDGSDQKRITFNEVDDWGPSWSVDGSKIFFASAYESDSLDIYKVNPDGSELEKIIENALQLTAVKNLDAESLKRLIKANHQ